MGKTELYTDKLSFLWEHTKKRMVKERPEWVLKYRPEWLLDRNSESMLTGLIEELEGKQDENK